MKTCPCGSGLCREELRDAAGIFCCFVCDDCEEDKRSRYNHAIFGGNSSYASTGNESALEIDCEGY